MNIFNKPYYRDSFLNDFLIDFLPDDFETEETPIPFEFSAGYISRVTRIGTCKSLKLDVFEMIHSSHNDARIGVSKDAFKILYNNSLCNRALVVFVPDSSRNNYRFSLLQIDASIDENDRLVRQYSNPRRFSFLLGTDAHIKTPTQFLIERGAIRERQEGNKLLNSFDDLLSRFSVEALTKQFYNELFKWYEWAIKISFFPKGSAEEVTLNQENNEQNIIRLITRIIFVWFIKQKNLVPDKIFDKKDLFNIINDFEPMSSESSSYYNAILQNLFFATLNRAVIDEQGCKRQFKNDNPEENNPHYGIKSFYRDNKVPKKSLFEISHQEVIDYFSTIPFLNGGLFECLDEIEDNSNVTQNYIDGFSREPSNRAFIPNILFFEPEEGLLPILSRYNFTIEENSPKEVQVALDPELLGKVFENLLGAYNPETRETARNQSGSFYTPKEIVEFMVDESLKAYLGNKEYTNLLFTQDELPIELQNDPEECNRISRKLSTAKILDPACGSGAFPMGMLNKIVELLEKLDYKKERDIGDIKLQLIENCIYGSDIQTIAVQISKLRFFISLICHFERNDHDKTNNYGIPILPNLETKFVAANSLISIKQKEGYGGLYTDPTGEIESTKRELLNIRKKHFSAHSSFLKIQLRKDDKEARQKLSKLLSVNIYAPQDAKQIAEWNPYDQNKTSSFFDPYWMFGVSTGFDIVIGNPPYISTKGIKEKDKKKYEAEFGFSDDTYNLFTFKGLNLTKNGGSLSYIIPKTFWTIGTKRGMRDLILGKQIRYIFDTANPFEAVMVDTCIIQVINEKFEGNNLIHFLDGSKDLRNSIVFNPIEQKIYCNTQNSVIFKPTAYNMHIWELYGEKVKELYNQWWDKIETSKKINKNAALLKRYRDSLKPGDIALLGCLTEGGQGLATANNGKYIAIRKSTKWANNILESRPKKLQVAMARYRISPRELNGLSPADFLATSTEQEIAITFDHLKEVYGRDIFGQGYIYKLIDDSELADVDSLTDDEKENGIDTSKKYYVPYDKGDKDGNRWYLETPFAIAWSKENVRFLKTNSGKKGAGMPVVRNPQFNFKEGFCWINVLNPQARLIKAKMKTASVNDVGSMSLSSICNQVPNYYFVSLLNSNLIFNYYRTFINCSVNIQINDIRMLPVIIPSKEELLKIEPLFRRAVNIKKGEYTPIPQPQHLEEELIRIEQFIDSYIDKLYSVDSVD